MTGGCTVQQKMNLKKKKNLVNRKEMRLNCLVADHKRRRELTRAPIFKPSSTARHNNPPPPQNLFSISLTMWCSVFFLTLFVGCWLRSICYITLNATAHIFTSTELYNIPTVYTFIHVYVMYLQHEKHFLFLFLFKWTGFKVNLVFFHAGETKIYLFLATFTKDLTTCRTTEEEEK